jgi:hypothetical protein
MTYGLTAARARELIPTTGNEPTLPRLSLKLRAAGSKLLVETDLTRRELALLAGFYETAIDRAEEGAAEELLLATKGGA